MKVISLVGARPQFIKEAVLQRQLQKVGIREVLVHSGQHYDKEMSDVFFSLLKIRKPDYNLRIGSGSHGEMTGKIMIAFEKIVSMERPDIIIVFGDTDTTLAGTLVGSKMGIKIAHIEAGIRMLPKDMPEEINRVIVDRISSYLFCPSSIGVENLKKEGIRDNVFFVGDIMYDLFLTSKRHISYQAFNKLSINANQFILVTIHRNYNVDDKKTLTKILENLCKINKIKQIVFSLHPRTKKRIKEFRLQHLLKDLITLSPVDYFNMMGLVEKSFSVITDSGGLQKEAYFAKKRAFVLMPDAGWRELIYNRWNILCSSDNLYDRIFNSPVAKYIPNIYGDGTAGEKIAKILSGL